MNVTRKSRVAIPGVWQIDFKKKMATKDNKGPYIMIKCSIKEEILHLIYTNPVQGYLNT